MSEPKPTLASTARDYASQIWNVAPGIVIGVAVAWGSVYAFLWLLRHFKDVFNIIAPQ